MAHGRESRTQRPCATVTYAPEFDEKVAAHRGFPTSALDDIEEHIEQDEGNRRIVQPAGVDRDHISEFGDSSRAVATDSWSALFRQMGHELEEVRGRVGSPGGPTELAATILAEAVAIGEALTSAHNFAGQGTASGRPTRSGDSTDMAPLFDGIDCRYLDHRARALRAALHGVDDYVWWGGLQANA